MTGSPLVFQRLHLPRPLDEQAIVEVMTWLAAAHDFPLVAFEARATAGRVEHLLGALPGQEHRLGRRGKRHLPLENFHETTLSHVRTRYHLDVSSLNA